MAAPLPPGPPQNLQVVVDEREAHATWDAPLDDGGAGVLRYRLSLELPGGGYKIATLPATQHYYTFVDLADGDYVLFAEAENISGFGDATPDELFAIAEPVFVPEGYVLGEVELRTETLGELVLPVDVPALADAVKRFTRQRKAGSRRGTLTMELVSGDVATAAYVKQERTVRIRWDSDTGSISARRYEWWRIEDVQLDDAGGDAFVATLRPIELDLDDTVAAYDRGDGTVDLYVAIYDVEVNEAVTMALTAFGVAGKRREGFVNFIPVQWADSITGVNVTIGTEGETHLGLLNMIAEAANGRVRFQHRAGNVYVGIVPKPDYGGLPVATVDEDHVFRLTRNEDSADLVTALVPIGGRRGEGFSIARVDWKVSFVTAELPGYELVSFEGAQGPVWMDGALVGTFVGNDAEGFTEVVHSAGGTVRVAAGTLTVGDYVRFAADAAGTDLIRLSIPELVPWRAPLQSVNERVRRYDDAVPAYNLLERQDLSADFRSLDGWTLLGGAAAEITADPDLARFGGRAQRITASALEDGIVSDQLNLASDGPPYASAWLALTVESGRWVVEMEDALGNVFGPGEDETAWLTGLTEAYALAGMQPARVPMLIPAQRPVKLRVRCVDLDGEASASIVLDAVAVTQSAVEYEYRPGMGPREIWQRAADELQRIANAPRVEFSGEIVDPNVLAQLPPIEVDELVQLEVRPPGGGAPEAFVLPVSSITEELTVGDRSHVRVVTLGLPDLDASVALGGGLGIQARAGTPAWTNARGLQTDELVLRRKVRAQRYTRSSRTDFAGSGGELVGRATIPTASSSVLVEPPATFHVDSVQVTPAETFPEYGWIHRGADGYTFEIAMASAPAADQVFTWRVTPDAGVVINFIVIDEAVEEVSFGWDEVPGVDGYQIRRYASEADALADTDALGVYTVPVSSLPDAVAPEWTIEVEGGTAFWYAVFSYIN